MFLQFCGNITKVLESDEDLYLVDSFPIILAKGQHAYTAKFAPELASKSFNATKKIYYYGVKDHVVARKRTATLPVFGKLAAALICRAYPEFDF